MKQAIRHRQGKKLAKQIHIEILISVIEIYPYRMYL